MDYGRSRLKSRNDLFWGLNVEHFAAKPYLADNDKTYYVFNEERISNSNLPLFLYNQPRKNPIDRHLDDISKLLIGKSQALPSLFGFDTNVRYGAKCGPRKSSNNKCSFHSCK